MSTLTLSPAAAIASNQDPETLARSPIGLRSLLVVGCVASAATAALLGHPATFIQADPELAFLLRGMAAIKASIVVASLAVIVWRLGLPMSRRAAASYIVGAWVLVGSTALIWQLSFIPLAALAFHLAGFLLLFTAWREHHGKPLFVRRAACRASHPSPEAP